MKSEIEMRNDIALHSKLDLILDILLHEEFSKDSQRWEYLLERKIEIDRWRLGLLEKKGS